MIYPKLKYLYYLFIPLICSAAVSCDADTPRSDNPAGGSEVKFDVDRLTRASDSPVIEKFAVYGDKKHPADNINPPAVVFSKTEVVYNSGSWSYEGVQHWYPKHEHSFVAIAPVSALETSDAPRYSNSQLSFTYNIPVTEAHQVSKPDDVYDILVATHRRLFEDGDAATTIFRFGHLMSQINLASLLDDNVMSDDEYINITKLELSGFKTGATFDIKPAPRQSAHQTDDSEIGVSGHSGEGLLTVEFAEPLKVVNHGEQPVSLFNASNAIIMLPQTFDAESDAKILIYYTVNEDPAEKQGILRLLDQKWESGKRYSYRFTIDRRGLIPGTTEISKWEVMNAGNIDMY